MLTQTASVPNERLGGGERVTPGTMDTNLEHHTSLSGMFTQTASVPNERLGGGERVNSGTMDTKLQADVACWILLTYDI